MQEKITINKKNMQVFPTVKFAVILKTINFDLCPYNKMKIQKISNSLVALSAIMLLLAVSVGSAFAYTYDVSEEQPWSDDSTTTSNVDYVQVRAYVPGSNYVTYKTVAIYSSTTSSGANSLGDVVGYTNNIYGTSPAFVDPYDGAKYSLEYPTYQLMKTRLYSVNDQRLALGDYMQTGAIVHEYIYDLIYKKFTTLSELNPSWTHLADMNNHGQVIGTSVEGGFAYDCQNGESIINIEGSTWTKPQRIDDEGNVYGTFSSPEMTETYFIATPDSATTEITCSLIRDDVFEPLVFGNGLSFEMSGDYAYAISVADFDGRGEADILIDHGGKVIVYKGERDFDKKTKYYGESFSTIFDNEFPDVIIPADITDVNNDGIDDSIVTDYYTTQISLGKGDGTYYYVPQVLNKVSKFADMNNDGFADIITVNGAFVSVQYQQPPTNPTPVDPTPEDTTPPVITLLGSSPIDVELNSVYNDAGATASDDVDGNVPVTITNTVNTTVVGTYIVTYDASDSAGNAATQVTRTVNVIDTTTSANNDGAPSISPDAEEVEFEGEIEEILGTNNFVIDGKIVWVVEDTIYQVNEDVSVAVGLPAQVKGMQNPDGQVIGISVEIN
ncbi:MAG: DUF5011 domain-containing protein [Nitrosopumilaceae archaeon]